MADKITDLPGLSQWGEYNGVTVNGQHYTPSQVVKDEGLSAAASGRVSQIYEAADGGYTTDPAKATTSFSWDNQTGKITISAPKVVQESDWFKQFTDNDNFKALSAAFESDPTGTTSLTSYDDEGNVQEKTIQEFLEDYQKAFEEYSKQYRSILAAKDEASAPSGGAIQFSDKNIYIWGHSTNRNSDKYDSSKVVYIPDIAKSYFDFSTLPSWNDDEKTVSAKDFYEWYDLDDGTEGKDELIHNLENIVAQMYDQYNKTQQTLSPEETDNEAIANDYARTVSFLRTLQADHPEANVFTSIRLFMSSAANSLVDNLTTTTGNLVLSISDFIDGLDAADETIVPLKIVTEPLKFTRGLYQTGELMFYNLGATISGIDIDAANNQLSEVAAIGELSDAVADGDADGLLDIISKNKGLSRALNARDLRDTLHTALLSAHDDMTRLSSAATAGSIIGGAIAEISKQVAVTNAVGAAAEYTVEGAVQGLAIIKNGLTPVELSGAVKLGAVSTNLVAQGLSDTILNDEEALRKMFVKGDPSDAAQAITLNTVFNGIGELTGLATTKGWDAFTKTSAGQTVEAFEQRTIAKVQYRKQRALANIAERLNKNSGNKISGADYYVNVAKAEANAVERIAHAGKYAKEGETITQATKRAVNDYTTLEYAFTRVNTQTSRTVLDIQTNPKIASQWNDTVSKAGEIAQLEGASGVSKSHGKVLYSQDVSDYISLSKRAQELSHKEVLTQNETEFLRKIQDRITDFRANKSTELVEAIDDYVHSLEKYYYDFNDMLVENGLLDGDTIASLRASGLWGTDGIEYIHLQAIKGTDQVKAAKDLVNKVANAENYVAKIDMEQYSYKAGDAEAHYLNPQLAALSQQIAIAKVIDAKEWGDALLKTQPFAQEINLQGKPVTTREIDALRVATQDASNTVFKKFATNEDIFQYDFADAYKLRENISGRISKKEKNINELLNLDKPRLNQVALNLDADGITVLRNSFDIPEYTTLNQRASLDELYSNASAAQKKAIDQAIGTDNLTLRSYNNAIRNTDLSERLTRAYIAENKEIMESAKFKEYATSVRTQQLTARQQTILKKNYDKIAELQKQAKLVELGEDEFTGIITKFTDDVINEISDELKNNAFFKEAIKRFTDEGVSESEAIRYLALNNLKKTLSSNNSIFSRTINKNLEKLGVSGNLTTRQKNRFSKAIKESLKDNVDSEWAESITALQKNGAGSLVDTETLFDSIRADMKALGDKATGENVIRVLSNDGSYKYYEVSPVTATLYNTRPNFSNVKNSNIVKFFNHTNRVFRIFTTGWSLSSFENQWLRDPLNAYVMGGMTRTVGGNTEELGRLLGPNVAGSMEDALSGRQPAEGVRETAERLYGGASQETQYYREMAQAQRDSLFGDYEKPIGKMEQALEFMEEHSLGNFRETYLRKAVYMSNYNKAIDMGKTTQEAAKLAEFTADNATTDFSRAFAWGNTLTRSVPYLGAAINGQKSFWRLLLVDPVGISGRFISGIVVPTMALTAQSLANESDREVYRNIPEYYKKDNIVFVVDGDVFKIPIPQELSAFVAPFRQLVEKANGGSDETWGELLLSDILSLPPVDLSGFADLDDPLGKDADFFSRLSNAAEELVSQLSPVAVKTAYMAATGRDPYTHSEINRQYTYVDSDGNLQIMDSEDNALAKWVSSMCKNLGISLSPSSAEAILSNFFGQAGIDFAGSLGNLFSGDIVGAASVYGTQISKPFVASSWNQADSAWKAEVSRLQLKKQALMANNSDLSKLSQQLLYATDADKIKTLRAQIKQIAQDYQEEVLQSVQAFNNVYGANYDYKKFASVINLLNFTNVASPAISDAALADAQELASDNRNAALQTMSEMGFNSTNDYSIFGYMATDNSGKTTWKATLPTAIVYSQNNNFYRGADETKAQLQRAITRTVDTNGNTLKDKYDEMRQKESEYYAKKDYTSLNKLYKEWDIEFMSQIYSVLAQNDLMDAYGNSILDNNEIIDLLDNYIRVPSDAMGKGRYISSSTGLNKQRGYAKSYIQKIYKQMRGE